MCARPRLEPRVSILLPTYNRASFLPAAFESIANQELTAWELVVVDDGSTDETERLVREYRDRTAQPVTYVKQANAGPYAARNRALDSATAPYVAFFDSDDIWLPHHLATCVAALEENPDVDWAYAACRLVDYQSGQVISHDSFRTEAGDRPFLQLHTAARGGLHVFDDERVVACALLTGLYCGLQNSVIRGSVFASHRFQADYRNEAEDQLFVIRSLKRGRRLGYIDDIHVQYHVHDANSSASAKGMSDERELAVYRPLVRGYEELRDEFSWSAGEQRTLAQRLAREYFWHIGYAVLWPNGRRTEALEAFRQGLRLWPWSARCWKTYLLARLRALGHAGDVS